MHVAVVINYLTPRVCYLFFLFLHEIKIVHKQRMLMNFIKKIRHFFSF